MLPKDLRSGQFRASVAEWQEVNMEGCFAAAALHEDLQHERVRNRELVGHSALTPVVRVIPCIRRGTTRA